MLLEGPALDGAVLRPAAREARSRAGGRIGHDVYRTVGGYVTGNLLISLIAGTLTTIVLLALGVPLRGRARPDRRDPRPDPARRARRSPRIIVATVAFLHSITAGIIVLVFFIVYQQVENHFLQPLIYGRTVQLSPLACSSRC